MKDLLRVHLVFGSPLFADALRHATQQEGMVLEASPDGFPFDARHIDADVVLIDVAGRVAEALELVGRWSEERPELRILPLGLDDRREILRFIEAGAAGYVPSSARLEEILRSIHGVARGEVPCHPTIIGMVFHRIAELARQREPAVGRTHIEPLSRREKEVLTLLAAGLQNKEIAKRLDIALCTAKNHVQRILNKLKAHRRRDAIKRAYEQGLLECSIPWQQA